MRITSQAVGQPTLTLFHCGEVGILQADHIPRPFDEEGQQVGLLVSVQEAVDVQGKKLEARGGKAQM